MPSKNFHPQNSKKAFSEKYWVIISFFKWILEFSEQAKHIEEMHLHKEGLSPHGVESKNWTYLKTGV